jgi:hypothetical protein
MAALFSSTVRFFLPSAILLLGLTDPCQSADSAAQQTPDDSTTAANLVRSALENELAGRNDDRNALLREAVAKSSDHRAAHWQSGEVWDGEKRAWLATSQIEAAARQDGRLAEYRRRRDAAGSSAADQIALAQWCRKNKLENEERVHWLIVLQMQPNHAEALQRLDLRNYRGMLLTGQQIARLKEQSEKPAKSFEAWRPLAVEWIKSLDRGQSLPPTEVRDKVVAISKPEEMLALQRALAREVEGKKPQLRAVVYSLARTLAGNPHPAAADCLTHLAIFSEWDEVRENAIAGLKDRPLDHFAPFLLGALEAPLQADIQFNVDADGNLISKANVYREGALADASLSKTRSPYHTFRDYSMRDVSTNIGARVEAPRDFSSWQSQMSAREKAWFAANPEAVRAWEQNQRNSYQNALQHNQAVAAAAADFPIYQEMMAEAQRRQNSMKSRVQAIRAADAFYDRIERTNKAIEQHNARIFAALRQTTGQEIDDEPLQWWKWWWQEYNGMYSVESSTPQSSDYDPAPYTPEPEKPVVPYAFVENYLGDSPAYAPFQGQMANFKATAPVMPARSCFAPGTKVWTLSGRLPIEQIKVGDRVLSQNVETGELIYKPVFAVTVRKPGPKMKVGLGEETIVATPNHPLWTVGQGWQMAGKLETGKRLHTLSGGIAVESVEKLEEDDIAATDYAYNLIVADFGTYFIGERGVLVHDNTPREPTASVIPGLTR